MRAEEFGGIGRPLPGSIWIPDYKVDIQKRGEAEVLEWQISPTPASPRQISLTSNLISVPHPVPESSIRRAIARRSEPRSNSHTGDWETLAGDAAISEGFHVQILRPSVLNAAPETPGGKFGGAGVLDDFVRFENEPAEVIQAFAEHWGPLGICSHSVPWTHSLLGRRIDSIEPVCAPLGVRKSQEGKGWEPVDKWRKFAQEANSIVFNAARLKNQRDRSNDLAKNDLANLFSGVYRWLTIAGVPLVSNLNLETESPWPCGLGIMFAITGVFQIVALQLLGIVAGAAELAPCSHCGSLFLLTGHREGSRRFCSTCIESKVPGRYASKAWRRRRRALAADPSDAPNR